MQASLEKLKALQPEVDYQALMAQMPGLSHPRRKLKELQNKGYLIRLKKGFYVFSQDFIGRAYSSQIVANLMYGPSYLSLEYALAFYSLIPERVETLTSVTSQKNKIYRTPIGSFSYQHLSLSLYPMAYTLKTNSDGRQFLIARPEKALLDLFSLKFDTAARPSAHDIVTTLEDDLRINLAELQKQIDRKALENIRGAYRNRRWNKLLIDFLLVEL